MTAFSPIVGKRILVLEDEPFIAMDIEHVLLDAGAAKVDLFFRMCREVYDTLRAIDAAVLDLDIEGISSLPLARALIEADIPFVFVSGHDEGVLGEEMRGRPFVTKPIDPTCLLGAVGTLWKARSEKPR